MDEKEFIIDTSFGGYTFVGAQYGRFTPQGETREKDYCNMFVLTPFGTGRNNHTYGLKAEKLQCLSNEVWNGLKPGDKLKIFFDRYGRVEAVGVVD